MPRAVALVTAASQAGYAFAPVGFALLIAGSGEGGLFAGAALTQLAAAAMFLLGRTRVTVAPAAARA
ncbi:MAG TPA: hypothetical protein VE650_19565 [Acetobacteraceae bacterium]|nr:hypothetical protein [Acetobacteraceae bacterium]